MTIDNGSLPVHRSGGSANSAIRPGDLVTSVTGYPILYEVLSLEAGDLLRVRGNNWASGYTAIVPQRAVRPVTGILSR
jgi:hypothetical protein